MPESSLFQFPTIDDAEITWAHEVMGLPASAFWGADGNDPRIQALKSLETLDIEACPGSGKTTLLVAKLAILANGWNSRRQGICVLSHTNAARREIENRLSNCAAGVTLVNYPHFVGTIHSFVNDYLATPWLRSLGMHVKAIDDDIAISVRWKKLPIKTRIALENAGYGKDLLRYLDADFNLKDIRWGKGFLDRTKDTYRSLVQACKNGSVSGYFCHQEMFIWAEQFLQHHPDAVAALRLRFPIVFIDEAQDNSDTQSQIIHKVFCEGDNPSIRQRLGDSNQAIYTYGKQIETSIDKFPAAPRVDLPNSFRFGQGIANFANPLGVNPQNLVGAGPSNGKITSPEKGHAIFLFDDASMGNVLAEYAKYLLSCFTELELTNGKFTAVCGVHDSDEDKDAPRFMGHYAPSYDPEFSRLAPSPRTFIQFLQMGQKATSETFHAGSIVQHIAAGILRLAQISGGNLFISSRRSAHRQVLELLSGHVDELAIYNAIVESAITCQGNITEADWNDIWQKAVATISSAISAHSCTSTECQAFLKWNSPVETPDVEKAKMPFNIFSYPSDNPKVDIRLGSIHSVKGETHTATLVLDSFFHDHHLKALKPWLLGSREGGKKGKAMEGVRMLGRLKLHYVAMTRPSHLLCLAMRRDSLTDDEIETLSARGWKIVQCEASVLMELAGAPEIA